MKKICYRHNRRKLLLTLAGSSLLLALVAPVTAQEVADKDPLLFHLEKQRKFEAILAKKLLPQETRYAKKLSEVEAKFVEAKEYANAQLIHEEALLVEARVKKMKSLQADAVEEVNPPVSVLEGKERLLHASEARTLGSATINEASLHLSELQLKDAAALWSLSNSSEKKALAYHVILSFSYQLPEDSNPRAPEFKLTPLRWKIEEGNYYLENDLRAETSELIHEQYLGALKVRGRNITLKLQLLGAAKEDSKEDLWSTKKEKEALQTSSADSPVLPKIEVIKVTLIPIHQGEKYSLDADYLAQRTERLRQASKTAPPSYMGVPAQLNNALKNKNYPEAIRLSNHLNRTSTEPDQSAAQELLQKYQTAHWAIVQKVSNPILNRYLSALPRRGEQPLITELISHQRRQLQTAQINPKTWQFQSHLPPEKQIPLVSQDDPPSLEQATLSETIYSGARFEIEKDSLDYIVSLEGVECPPLEMSKGHLQLWAQRLQKSEAATLAFATEAAAFTRSYLSDEAFSFEGNGDKDLWGSHQGTIRLKDLPSYQKVLLSRGLALVSNNDPDLLKIQTQARKEGRGVWANESSEG